MKSAYQLAMERLEKQAPGAKLTEEQKTEIAGIEALYKAKAAEKEVFLKDQIEKALADGKAEDVASLEKQLSFELKRLSQDCEEKKEKIRSRPNA